MTGLLLGMLLAALDQTIVATALPTIAGDLHSLARLSWIVTAYLLASTVSTPLWGKLGDLYGRKIFFQAAIVIFLVGSVLAGLSETITELIIFRAIQGIGGGGLLVGAQTIVGDIVTPRDRGRYQGFFGAVFGVASVLGPLIGGFFVDTLSWRWVFYVNLPIGVVTLIVVTAVLASCWPSDRRPSRCCRCACSASRYSPLPRRSASWLVSLCSARSHTCRSTSRLSRGSAQRSPACACSRRWPASSPPLSAPAN
jgi:MFS family permease